MPNKLSRRQALASFASIGLGAAMTGLASRLSAADAKDRPNIIYIMTDDHAAHAISCYGSRINKTPNLDRLAAGGMRFENAFTTNAICGPGRACLLTGKYSHMHGYRDNTTSSRFDGSQQTFPKLLQQAGYQTAMIGKWHLKSDPQGFDHWCILPGDGRYADPEFIDKGKKEVVKGYVTDVITDKTIDWLKNRDATKPFCVLCHHKAPHREWNPDAKHAKLYEDDDIPVPPTFNDDYSNRSPAAREATMTVEKHLTKADLKQDPPAGLTPEQLKNWKYQRYIKDYLRCIASVDDNIGRLLDYLDESGLAKNTIVIYTSDNGFFLGDHGWYDKRFMYEQGFRVPLIIRYPGQTNPGSATKDMAINCDFGPTILDCAGTSVPADMQGRSLKPVLAGSTPGDWRKSVYYHYYEYPGPHRARPHYGVRGERYKLIHFYTIKEWELFDLQADPNELKNVYADPAYAKVREEMTAELNRLRAEYKDNDPV